MKTADLVARLSKGVESVVRSHHFCVSGAMTEIDPRIDVAGLGAVKLPLKQSTAKRLMAECVQAPYGKGTKTLVNTKVRNAFELAPRRFTLTNPEWDQAIQQLTPSIATKLGLPTDRLEARLYKLLLYGKGGFFLPHRDSEKSDRMVGSLIIALPTPFSGGTLAVRHQGETQRMDFKEAALGQSPSYAAFYADCEHEVSRVTHGFRLCLAYNLVLSADKSAKRATSPAPMTPAQEVAGAISGWITTSPPSEPLVFALDHHYTERGLSLDLLKGADRATAELVAAAAENAGCHVYLCQVSRHVMQHADDGRWDRRWSYSDAPPRNLNLGEIYVDELLGEQWVDANGRKQAFPAIALSTKSIVASTPLDQWKPTREEYEGYTGNAGNTLDRWYHRSALCVWHRDHHFSVLAGGDVYFAVKMLAGIVGKLKRTAKKRFEDARGECIRLAQAIVGQWPKRHLPRHHYGRDSEQSQALDSFPELLAQIDDPETTRQLLRAARERDAMLDLGNLVVGACRIHGCGALANELAAFFEFPRDELCVRDFVWLDKLAGARLDDPDRDALLAKLSRLAATRFCEQPAPRFAHQDDPSNAKETLPALLRVLVIAADEPMLERVIRFVADQPARFSLEDVQVPSLSQVVGWMRKQKSAIHPLLIAWLRTIQQRLITATAQEPQPPADWARPAEIACTCQHCRRLNEILAAPNEATGRIHAREDMRSHLITTISRHQCDVTHKLEKTGSPYALVFTKTDGSYQRRLKRYCADQELLETVNDLLCGQTERLVAHG